MISGILNVINVFRHYILGDGKVFPRHHVRQASIYIIRTPLLRNLLITNQPTTNPIAPLIRKMKLNELIIDQPITQPIRIFVLGCAYLYMVHVVLQHETDVKNLII